MVAVEESVGYGLDGSFDLGYGRVAIRGEEGRGAGEFDRNGCGGEVSGQI